jgi:molybdopterin molybdotransferase
MPLRYQKPVCTQSFEEAVRRDPGRCVATGVRKLSLLDSLGRVSALDVSAPWSTPRYDNSAMDGFAVRAADCGPVRH